MGAQRSSRHYSNYAFLIIVVQIIFSAKLAWAECEWDEDELNCDLEPTPITAWSPGAIAGIILGAAAFVIGLSVLLCFICACLCFSGRNGSTKGQVHSVTVNNTAPPTGNQNMPGGGMVYYNQQPYNYGGLQAPYYQSPPPYNGALPQSQQSNPSYPQQH